MQIIAREHYTRMPWKNGKGLTEEVMAFPAGSTVETFDWRLSIAHVGQDGPFSVFPSVDRSIALLDGEGLRLNLPGDGEQVLTPHGEPFVFPGDWVISSTNIGGPTIDLNIMTRRGRYRHHMCRQLSEEPIHIKTEAQTLLVFMNAAAIGTPEETIAVEPLSSVMLDSGEQCTITSPDTLHVLIITLHPAE